MPVKKITEKLLNIIFPVKCLCCKKISSSYNGEDILCEECKKILTEEAACNCTNCGKSPNFCECKKIKLVDGIVFTYFYTSDILAKAIYAVKKSNLYYINEFFAKGMYNSLKSCDKIKIGGVDGIDFITHTPRKKDSIKLYGYNQTAVLAKLISKYTGISYMPVVEASNLYDTEQKSLGKTERALNVKNKFTVTKNIRKNKDILKGRNILIIDDVVTTGSTLSECARIMKNMGAKNIYALCAASVLVRKNNNT